MSTVTWLWSVTGSGPQSVTWIAIRSRGRGHVIAIINWPGPQSGTWSSRFCLQSSVCQARPKDIIPGCPFRQVITIINITYINIGVCCSVINWSIVFTLCMVYDGATDHTSPPDQTGIVSPWEGGSKYLTMNPCVFTLGGFAGGRCPITVIVHSHTNRWHPCAQCRGRHDQWQ